MTKLEQKLIELGYEKGYLSAYHKRFNNVIFLTIENYEEKGIFGSVYSERRDFIFQEHIDNLQQAFNQLQSDLKELKEDENI